MIPRNTRTVNCKPVYFGTLKKKLVVDLKCLYKEMDQERLKCDKPYPKALPY